MYRFLLWGEQHATHWLTERNATTSCLKALKDNGYSVPDFSIFWLRALHLSNHAWLLNILIGALHLGNPDVAAQWKDCSAQPSWCVVHIQSKGCLECVAVVIIITTTTTTTTTTTMMFTLKVLNYILFVYTTYIFPIVISPMLLVALPVNSTTSHGASRVPLVLCVGATFTTHGWLAESFVFCFGT